MNKRGMELAINTVVILVLSIMVLIFVVLFFTDAGKGFMSKIGIYQGYSNVDVVIDRCNFYFDTGAEYSYCCEEKNVRYLENGDKMDNEMNCLAVSQRFGGVEELDCRGIKC